MSIKEELYQAVQCYGLAYRSFTLGVALYHLIKHGQASTELTGAFSEYCTTTYPELHQALTGVAPGYDVAAVWGELLDASELDSFALRLIEDE